MLFKLTKTFTVSNIKKYNIVISFYKSNYQIISSLMGAYLRDKQKMPQCE